MPHSIPYFFKLAFTLLAVITFLNARCHGSVAPQKAALENWSLSHLEERRDEIDDELSSLSELSLRSGVGAIGFRSERLEDANSPQWIEVQLEGPTTINSVVLVPTIRRTMRHGFQADGFPLEFRIIAGTDTDREGTQIAHVNAEAHHLPRIAPLVVSVQATKASWIRIETLRLSKRHHDGFPCLQLAELLVFNGAENVAFQRPV